MRRSPSSSLATLLTVVVMATARCGASGASTAPSPPSVAGSTPTAGTPASGAPTAQNPSAATPTRTSEATMAPFTLTSTSFTEGGSIPRRFTCDGDDVSPDLAWDGVPEGTAALLLLVDDPDARGFVHWLVLDVDGSQSGALPLGVSASPDAPRQGRNDFGRIGWAGPCPPSGTHRYTFTLYALSAPLGLAGTPGGDAVRKALDGGQVLATTVLEGRYRRG